MRITQWLSSLTHTAPAPDIELEDMSGRFDEMTVREERSLQPAQSEENVRAIRAMQSQQSSNARARLFPDNAVREERREPSSSAAQTGGIEGIAAVESVHAPTTMIPIRMKSVEDARKMGIDAGVSQEINLTIAQRREYLKEKAIAEGTALPPPMKVSNYFSLKKIDGKYVTQGSEDGKEAPANGKYNFITLLDGTIRLSRPDKISNAHAALGGNSLYVAYAGEVNFKDGELEWFSNQSGAYLPEENLHHQSGFESEKFIPVTPKRIQAAPAS